MHEETETRCIKCKECEAYYIAYPICRACWVEVCVMRAEMALTGTKRALRRLEAGRRG